MYVNTCYSFGIHLYGEVQFRLLMEDHFAHITKAYVETFFKNSHQEKWTFGVSNKIMF